MSRARRSTSPSKEGLSAPARGSWTDELPRRLWVDKAGAMAYLSIGEKLLDELRAAGHVRYFKVGSKLLFSTQLLEEDALRIALAGGLPGALP